ncbi:hypothetical protein NC652_016138 [Populus alba x Populus x berolinensis]|nr:hypothetical protein NC652_016138 [Populus alba x Populus x berolinensis]
MLLGWIVEEMPASSSSLQCGKRRATAPGMLRELHGRGPFHRVQCRLQRAGQEE